MSKSGLKSKHCLQVEKRRENPSYSFRQSGHVGVSFTPFYQYEYYWINGIFRSSGTTSYGISYRILPERTVRRLGIKCRVVNKSLAEGTLTKCHHRDVRHSVLDEIYRNKPYYWPYPGSDNDPDPGPLPGPDHDPDPKCTPDHLTPRHDLSLFNLATFHTSSVASLATCVDSTHYRTSTNRLVVAEIL